MAPTMLEELCKRIQHCCATFRRSRKKCCESLAEKFDRFQTLRNSTQQHPRACNRVSKPTQHVTSNNVASVCTQPYDFLPFSLQSPSSLGSLRSDDGDGNGNATKARVLISKTTILHVHHSFLYVSLPSLHDYDVKMPNFALYRGSTQATTKFPLSFCTWLWFLGIQL